MQKNIAFINTHSHEPYDKRWHQKQVFSYIGRHYRNRSKPLQRRLRNEKIELEKTKNKANNHLSLNIAPAIIVDDTLTTSSSESNQHPEVIAIPDPGLREDEQDNTSIPRSPASQPGSNVDPFAATTLSVYGGSLKILYTFVARWERNTWGWTWGQPWRQTQNLPNPTDTGVALSLRAAMNDPGHMVMLLHLANTQNLAEAPSAYDTTFHKVVSYQAARLLNQQMGQTTFTDLPKLRHMLFDISCVCLAAFFQSDFEVARWHLRGANALAQLTGGVLSLPRYMSEILLQSDYIVAWHDLSSTVFDVYDLTPRTPPEPLQLHPTLLKYIPRFETFCQSSRILASLETLGKDVTTCVLVFSMDFERFASLKMARWTTRRCHACLLRLLSMKEQMGALWSSQRPSILVQIESSRITMLMWLSILMSFSLHDSVRFNTITQFSDEAIRSFSGQNLDVIAEALADWNLGTKQLLRAETAELGVAFSRLCAVIGNLEEYGCVRLAPLMQQVFSLARTHHHWKKFAPPAP